MAKTPDKTSAIASGGDFRLLNQSKFYLEIFATASFAALITGSTENKAFSTSSLSTFNFPSSTFKNYSKFSVSY